MLNSCCAILVNSLLLRSTPKYRADGTSVGTAVKCESGATMNEETLQEVAEEKATEPRAMMCRPLMELCNPKSRRRRG